MNILRLFKKHRPPRQARPKSPEGRAQQQNAGKAGNAAGWPLSTEAKCVQHERSAESKDLSAKPAERFEIVLSGSGGQGMVLAGKILAQAATLYDNREAVMTKSYGPEARGGASKTEVIIDSHRIDYPSVLCADVFLALSRQALDKYRDSLDEKSLLIMDETFIKEAPPHIRFVFKAPFAALAIKTFNTQMVANSIALGSLVEITKVVSKEALMRGVAACVSPKTLQLNQSAIDLGFKIAAESGFVWRKA